MQLWLKLRPRPLQPEPEHCLPVSIGLHRWNRYRVLLLLGCALLAGCQSHFPMGGDGQRSLDIPAGLSGADVRHIDAEPLNVKPAIDVAGQRGYLITTGPYRIFTTIKSSMQQHLIARVLRAGWMQFKKLLPSACPHQPFYGYIFTHRRQWATFTRHVMGKLAKYYVAPGVNGYDHDAIFALYGNTVPLMLSVAAHEAWLQFSYASLKDHLPAWMDEGLATQFEAIGWRHGRPVFEPALNYPRWLALRMVCRSGQFIPLHIFTRISAGVAVAAGPRMTEIYYAQLWSFMLFLTMHDGWPAINRALRWAQRGRLTAALRAAGLSPSDLRNETARWNLVAGPLFFQRFMERHDQHIFTEYRQFAEQIAAHWPPRMPR